METKKYRHWLAIIVLVTGSLLVTGIDVNAWDPAKILGEDWASNGLNLDTQWTMSGGNDGIHGGIDVPGGGLNGFAPIPEPATMLLFGAGLVGLGAFIRKRHIKK